MTRAMYQAVDLLRRAHRACPSTDDGVVTAAKTFYDAEVDVAYVHHATAHALERAGYVQIEWDPDGSPIHLIPNR